MSHIVWTVLCCLVAVGGWILAIAFGFFVYLRRDKIKADEMERISLNNKIAVREEEIRMRDERISALDKERKYWKEQEILGVLERGH
jgi:hypothetical protein